MRITRFTAENFMRLKVVDITPDGDVITLAGPNGAGKSAVLNAVFAALGGKDAVPGKPIRRGESKARVSLDLGEIIVTRRFTETDSTVIVEGANGARFPSPQRMLDSLIGQISFDPLRFARLEAKAQFEMLRGMVKLDVDVDALTGLNRRDFENRTEINRRAKALRAQADGVTVPAGLPETAIDTAALVDEIARAGEHNADIERRKERRGAAVSQIRDQRQNAQTKRDRAAELRRQADELDAQAKQLTEAAADTEKKLDEAPPLPEPIDAAEVRARLTEAEATNKAIERRTARERLVKQAEEAEAESKALTETMAARDKAKTDAIATAKFPIAGLSFGDGEVLYDGLPLAQASTAEQIRVSMAVAMALNPKLRVLCIREASFLDEGGLKIVAEMAKEGGYQVWLEDCRSTDPLAIVMEDGHVANAPQPEQVEAAE